MKKILIDTMHILELLTTKDSSYVKLSQALDDEKISGVISVTLFQKPFPQRQINHVFIPYVLFFFPVPGDHKQILAF